MNYSEENVKLRAELYRCEQLLRHSIDQYEGHGYSCRPTLDSAFGQELYKIRELLGLSPWVPEWDGSHDDEIVKIK